jgi:nitronate monooxygenase
MNAPDPTHFNHSAPLVTRLTERYALTTPIVAAPMALASGGALAAAVAQAGGLGFLGGGYGDLAWVQREHALAAKQLNGDLSRYGVGFISWTAEKDASAFDWILDLPEEARPVGIFLSFAATSSGMVKLCQRVKHAGLPLFYQVQTMAQLPAVLDCGADVIIAQGGEAGGHGMNSLAGRATITLVPEIADVLVERSPETLLLAAGGIADGRGLAAALMLGADGAVIGSRFWAAAESLAAKEAKDAAIAANGDGTARTAVFDILRRKQWPREFDFRALRNDLHRQWETRVEELRANPDAARADYDAGVAALDYRRAHATAGEVTGLIHDAPGAAELLARIDQEARACLARFALKA